MGGSFKVFFFCVLWLIGEFGGMGFEGVVKFGYCKELEVEIDLEKWVEFYDKFVVWMYMIGKVVNVVMNFEIDDVIDFMILWDWIFSVLRFVFVFLEREGKK